LDSTWYRRHWLANVVRELNKGTHYDTVAYGTVLFMGAVPDNNTASGLCYKFKTERGRIKYLRHYELETFLRKEQ